MLLTRTARAAVSLALVLSIGGCSSLPAPYEALDKASPGNDVSLAAHNTLIDHPSAIVSGPAGFGLGIGTSVGIPLMIAALPFTIALGIAAWSDDPKVS